MNKTASYIICILIFFSCAVRKSQIQEGVTFSAQGLLLVISNSPERYFVECYEIIDTLNILENIINEGNVGSAIYLHNSYMPVNLFVSNNQQMTSFKMKEGEILHAKLVKISYTEFHTLISPELNKAEIYLKDTIIEFDFKMNIYRINYVMGLYED
jgi:hypothetical protein